MTVHVGNQEILLTETYLVPFNETLRIETTFNNSSFCLQVQFTENENAEPAKPQMVLGVQDFCVVLTLHDWKKSILGVITPFAQEIGTLQGEK